LLNVLNNYSLLVEANKKLKQINEDLNERIIDLNERISDIYGGIFRPI
jgi:hypothetical protein